MYEGRGEGAGGGYEVLAYQKGVAATIFEIGTVHKYYTPPPTQPNFEI